MKVWVTRTRPGADRTAHRLRALGHQPLIRPVLEVCRLPVELDPDGTAALAFTSANAVEAFAALHADRSLPVFTVGAGTAAAARQAGFHMVRSADGDVEALADLIAAARPRGPVLHAAGRPRAGDLQTGLAARGVGTRTLELYETRPVPAPEPPDDAGAVLVHSPHAARVLARAGLNHATRLFCLSDAVAAPLLEAGFSHVAAAPRPDETALLALLPPGLGAAPEGR